MKVLKPIPVDDAVFVSSTVPETDFAAWNGATNYAADTQVVHVHRIWKSISGGIHAAQPQNDEDHWGDMGAVNAWKMFDDKVNTVTTATGSITVVLEPGPIDAIGFQELTGDELVVELRDGAGGPLVATRTVDLDRSVYEDIYDFFFSEVVKSRDAFIDDLPPLLNSHITITITGDGAVGCGVCVLGNAIYIGEVEDKPKSGRRSTTKVNRDENTDAVTGITKRPSSKRNEYVLWLEPYLYDRTDRLLDSLDGVLCLWVGVDENRETFAPLSVYGFTKDFSIAASSVMCLVSLQLEGVI